MAEESMTAVGAYQKIIQKAVEDPEFRQALKADPRGTVEATLATPVPEGMEIEVLEQSSKVTYLVLPWRADELTDEQLDAVAGGGVCWDRACDMDMP